MGRVNQLDDTFRRIYCMGWCVYTWLEDQLIELQSTTIQFYLHFGSQSDNLNDWKIIVSKTCPISFCETCVRHNSTD